MKNKFDIGRRESLKKIGALSLAGAAVPGLAVAGSAEKGWDKTVEIAIVGSGFAGLAAAIEAIKKGAKSVTIFEKMPIFGGNSAINGGLFAVPNTPLQQKEGIKDSPETMLADQLQAGRGICCTVVADLTWSTCFRGSPFIPCPVRGMLSRFACFWRFLEPDPGTSTPNTAVG